MRLHITENPLRNTQKDLRIAPLKDREAGDFINWFPVLTGEDWFPRILNSWRSQAVFRVGWWGPCSSREGTQAKTEEVETQGCLWWKAVSGWGDYPAVASSGPGERGASTASSTQDYGGCPTFHSANIKSIHLIFNSKNIYQHFKILHCVHFQLSPLTIKHPLWTYQNITTTWRAHILTLPTLLSTAMPPFLEETETIP